LDASLYRYPFDKDGPPALSFGEAVIAARILETELGKLMERWTWPEIWLRIVERRPGYVRYEVHRNGKFLGIVTVMPYSVAPPKHEPASTLDEASAVGHASEKFKRA
jgi:hypothetical protein